MARIVRFLRGQRPNHVLQSDYYINWGETITSLVRKWAVSQSVKQVNMSMTNNHKRENVKRVIASQMYP